MEIHRKSLALIALTTVLLVACGGGNRGGENVAGDSNQRPVATPSSHQVVESNSLDIVLSGTDADDDSLTYQLVSSPSHGLLTGTAPSLVYTPEAGFIGTDVLTFSVNDGETDSEVAEVQVEVTPSLVSETLDTLIDQASNRLASDLPPMTEEAFQQTELAKHHLSDAKQKVLNEAFSLVSSYTGPDPDLAWFSTQLSQDLLLANSGDKLTVTLKKLDREGQESGDIDPTRLKLVIGLQRDNGTVEKIPASDTAAYAHFVAGRSEVEITVPADLDKGRLLVAIRPNLDDPGKTALAERWSALIDVEVWPLNTNVYALPRTDVLFPLSGAAPGLAPNARFSVDEIAAEMQTALDNDDLFLPLVVQDTSLQTGQLVHYSVEGRPYGGRVEHIVARGNQQLIMIAPDWLDAYNVPETDADELLDLDILPQHIVYRNEEPQENTKDQSTRSAAGASAKASQPKQEGWFSVKCTGPTADLDKTKKTLLFAPFLKFDRFDKETPVDFGIDFSYSINGEDAECIWKAKKDVELGKFGRTLLALGGGVLKGLLGTDFKTEVNGQFKLKLESELPLLFGVTAGYSLSDGATNPNISFVAGEAAGSDGLRDLLGASVVLKASGAASAGVKIELNLLSSRGVFGWLSDRLGNRIKFPDIGIKSTVDLGGGLSIKAATAAAVYRDGEISEAAIERLTVKLKVEVTPAVTKLLKRVLTDIEFEITPLDIVLLEGDTLAANYTISDADVDDDFNGTASIKKITPPEGTYRFLIAGERNVAVMGPANRESSIFKDQPNKIEYEVQECDDSSGNRITAPAIVCSLGVFCGQSNEVELCADPAIPTYGEWNYHISDSFLDSTDGIVCRAGGGQMVGRFPYIRCENRDSALTDESTLLPAASRFFANLGRGGCVLETAKITWPVVLPIWSDYVRYAKFVNGQPVKGSDKATSKPSDVPKNNCNNILFDAFFSREREVLCPTGYHLASIGSEKNYLGFKGVTNELRICRKNVN